MLENKRKKIAIIGARSKTAEALIRILPAETDWEILLFSSGLKNEGEARGFRYFPLNYADPKALRDICLRELPEVIINTSAMTNVDACEHEKQLAWTVNVTWVEQLVRTASVIDAHLVHFSTDYVFNGEKGPYTETDAPHPLSYYGKSKLASENACMQARNYCSVIRTNVVYGFSANEKVDFVQWVIAQSNKGMPFTVVDDQYSNPTLTDDLARAVLKIIQKKRTGLYHVGGADYLNRIEFARQIAKIFHLDESLIRPVSTESLAQAAKRPLRGGLVALKAETDLGFKFCGIESGLITVRHQMHAFKNIQQQSAFNP
jgi:dTDP-4-dehydrorhamnose reductase